jgi:nicotinate-nucleotide adenylyltransferase
MSTRADAPLAIFGGTFDPVHFGHLRAASEVKEQLGVDDFRLLPAGDPPHRTKTFSTPAQRLAMLRLALAEHPDIGIDDRELRRDGPSWMVDTLADLRREAPHRPLLLVIGRDAAHALDGWHEWRRLFDLAHLVVMTRPGSGTAYREPVAGAMRERLGALDELLASPAGRVLHLAVTQLEISSTGIRRSLSEGRSPRFLLPDAVLGYALAQGLYAG